MSDNHDFYDLIESFPNFSQFTELELYRSLPEDWYIVISDVKGSTIAIENGKYKEVNSISTASISAMLNAVSPIKVPYVFGGDGATFCIPPSKRDAAASALVAARTLARTAFGLDLRVGMVAAREVRQFGHEVLVGKYRPSLSFQQAMFQGDGLRFAEDLIKDPSLDNPYLLDESQIQAEGNFEGFECRWNEIPSSSEETVSIIVQALTKHDNNELYERVENKIIQIYGKSSDHHPVRVTDLSLSLSPQKLSIESRIRNALKGQFSKTKYLIRLWFLTLIGKWLMAKNIETDSVDWGRYKQRLITNTDYRKFDEILRMVISGTRDQRQQLKTYLDSLLNQRQVVYGLHASSAAVITCMVFDYGDDHIHFLDGSDGGYAMAAKSMKKQLADLQHTQSQHAEIRQGDNLENS